MYRTLPLHCTRQRAVSASGVFVVTMTLIQVDEVGTQALSDASSCF
jgi:hypothetical protein